MNSKLQIGHDILKIIPSKNRSKSHLVHRTKTHCIAHVTTKLRCNLVLKMTQNRTKPHYKHP